MTGPKTEADAIEIVEFIDRIPPMVALGLLVLGVVVGVGVMIVLSEDFRNARNHATDQ